MKHHSLHRCLGAVNSEAFQRLQNEKLLNELQPWPFIVFDHKKSSGNESVIDTAGHARENVLITSAHQAGTNCLTIDKQEGRFLVSGGADATVQLWDLDSRPTSSPQAFAYHPSASLTRSSPSAHSHAITSISIYPFDPVATTLITTSHDKTLKLTAITPSSLSPIHAFSLDFAPYTHSLSPIPTASPLIAVGTSHPSIRLLDLRSSLSTHSLPGHNGAVYSLCWSPQIEHVLASGAADGRVLFFDIRRANAAFASLDLDDAIGVVGESSSTGSGARSQLDWNAQAHHGPVTCVAWTPSGDKIVTAGHDQRIRLWDSATGRNELVHFGPRIKNERLGPLCPLLSPRACSAPGRELLFWPNDDGRGDIYVHQLREGNMTEILRTPGVPRAQQGSKIGKLTSGGRINGMVWRWNSNSGEGLEMYSAHGDGRIVAWGPSSVEGEDNDDEKAEQEATEEQRKKKRKRDLVGDLVQGLTKRPATLL